jgi:hypothetical protein
MAKANKPEHQPLELLQKCPTGIKGLVEITGGGLTGRVGYRESREPRANSG